MRLERLQSNCLRSLLLPSDKVLLRKSFVLLGNAQVKQVNRTVGYEYQSLTDRVPIEGLRIGLAPNGNLRWNEWSRVVMLEDEYWLGVIRGVYGALWCQKYAWVLRACQMLVWYAFDCHWQPFDTRVQISPLSISLFNVG